MGTIPQGRMRPEIVNMTLREMTRKTSLRGLLHQLRTLKNDAPHDTNAIRGLLHQIVEAMPECLVKAYDLLGMRSRPTLTLRERMLQLPGCFAVRGA